MTPPPVINVVSPMGDPAADRELLTDIRTHLGQHEAINTIQLAALMVSDRFDPAAPVLVAMRDHRILAIGSVHPGFNLLLSTIEASDEPAIEAIAAEVVHRQLAIPGVMGPSRPALNFARHWARLSGGSYQPGMTQRILSATSVRFPDEVPGTSRHIRDEDESMLIEWFSAFGTEAVGVEPAHARGYAKSMLGRLGPNGGGLLWLDDAGVPVSVACYQAPTLRGIRIGHVYTPPEHRRRGYAGAVTAATTQLMLDRGFAFVCLYTDATNPTANHVYESIGYRFVADSMQYRFEGGKQS